MNLPKQCYLNLSLKYRMNGQILHNVASVVSAIEKLIYFQCALCMHGRGCDRKEFKIYRVRYEQGAPVAATAPQIE